MVSMIDMKTPCKSLEVFGSTATSTLKSKTKVPMLHLNPKVSANINSNEMPNKKGEVKDWNFGVLLPLKVKYLD